ncbi:hypothetical protein LCGC14_0614420 [marine sediment metagenome]|uniref:Uncharacterized protein n=1 Tax=marine sediment metagenome TaxID=412755 RepID=A0A0F9RBN0_9ZZZZ
MTPNTEIINQEIDLESKRITVSVDEVTEKIIENLIGVKGRSKSSVIYQIIRDWIEDNSELIRNNWGINFAAIRRQVISKYKEVPVKKELTESESHVIRRLAELFKTIKSISADELAEELDIDAKTLRKIIFTNTQELETAGLKLAYEDGKFFPT